MISWKYRENWKNIILEITNIDKKRQIQTRGMELKVTDDRLIELSGGIVQGTSGSPHTGW